MQVIDIAARDLKGCMAVVSRSCKPVRLLCCTAKETSSLAAGLIEAVMSIPLLLSQPDVWQVLHQVMSQVSCLGLHLRRRLVLLAGPCLLLPVPILVWWLLRRQPERV